MQCLDTLAQEKKEDDGGGGGFFANMFRQAGKIGNVWYPHTQRTREGGCVIACLSCDLTGPMDTNYLHTIGLFAYGNGRCTDCGGFQVL